MTPRNTTDTVRYELWHELFRLATDLHRLAETWWREDPDLRHHHDKCCGLSQLPLPFVPTVTAPGPSISQDLPPSRKQRRHA